MKASFWKYLWGPVACLSLCPVLAFAQSPDFSQNLAACKAGREACDQSRLSAVQLTEVALANHARNVANCRNHYDSCDHSKLSEPETVALAVADHQRNATDCNDGMQSCDRSKLTPSEAREMDAAQQERNFTVIEIILENTEFNQSSYEEGHRNSFAWRLAPSSVISFVIVCSAHVSN